MSAHCTDHCSSSRSAPPADPLYRRVLWVALGVNAAMFLVELGAGLHAGSVSLLADAIDFFGDAANYAISLVVLGMALPWRSRAALFKGICMVAFGLFVAGRALWAASTGSVPDAFTMGAVGSVALAANVGVALMLYHWRSGDANMRSVWLCSRNDALGNLAVMAAALGVFGTGSAWPDLGVALVMAALGVTGGWSVIRQARQELEVPSRASASAFAGAGPQAQEVVRTLLREWTELPRGDQKARWVRLQAAHVAGQALIGQHTRVHVAMLQQAVLDRDVRESGGQLLRLAVLPLGHLTGRLPWGNSGRSDVSAFRPMQPAPDVLDALYRVRRHVGVNAATPVARPELG